MKKLVRLSAIAALFLFSSLAANAQIKVGINGGVQLPMGKFSDYSKTGFGGGISGKYMLNPNMGVGLNVGFYSFDGKELGDGVLLSSKLKSTIIPITANYTYYFGEGTLKPYVGVDLGLSMVKAKSTVSALGFSSSSDSTVTKFCFAPVVGAEYSLNENLALDLNVKYNCILDGAADIKSTESKTAMATTLGINLGLVYTIK